MKKIWPWLLLLLLLIIFCIWTKIDNIHVTSKTPTHTVATAVVPVQERYMDYTITQKDTSYTLQGNFAKAEYYESFRDTHTATASNLAITHTSINPALLGEKTIALTNKILPHFIKNYSNGKIVYADNKLSIYGDVNSYDSQREMQNLLNTSTIASQDNTNVIQKKPIDFAITKTLEKVDFTGTFNDEIQGNTLRSKLPTSTTATVTQGAHLVDNGVIAFTQSILPSFLTKYKRGKLVYKEEVLTVSGMVQSEADLNEMKTLLASSNLNVVNNTILDPEAIAKAKANLQAEEEAKLAKTEALVLAKAEEEKEALALIQEAKEKEAKANKEAQEQANLEAAKAEVKEKITKLLQIENIEFRVSKGSLTSKGRATVDKLATILSQHPNINVEIAGHTDSDGSGQFNQKLSQKRVNTARDRLVTKGIDSKRIKAIGYGESKPLVPNTTRANKQKNRRVEIHIQGE